MADTIYKIVPEELWREARRKGTFDGAGIDLADGYIHFSTASQVRETAAKHFAGKEDLFLVAIDGGALGDALKYEPSRGGDLFPHLYEPLSMDAVLWETPLSTTSDGSHVFPDLGEGR